MLKNNLTDSTSTTPAASTSSQTDPAFYIRTQDDQPAETSFAQTDPTFTAAVPSTSTSLGETDPFLEELNQDDLSTLETESSEEDTIKQAPLNEPKYSPEAIESLRPKGNLESVEEARLKMYTQRSRDVHIEKFMDEVISYSLMSEEMRSSLKAIKNTLADKGIEALKNFIQEGIKGTGFYPATFFSQKTTNVTDFIMNLLTSGVHPVVAALIKGDDARVTFEHLTSFATPDTASASTSTSTMTRKL